LWLQNVAEVYLGKSLREKIEYILPSAIRNILYS
jgi:hypothetical protein